MRILDRKESDVEAATTIEAPAETPSEPLVESRGPRGFEFELPAGAHDMPADHAEHTADEHAAAGHAGHAGSGE